MRDLVGKRALITAPGSAARSHAEAAESGTTLVPMQTDQTGTKLSAIRQVCQ